MIQALCRVDQHIHMTEKAASMNFRRTEGSVRPMDKNAENIKVLVVDDVLMIRRIIASGVLATFSNVEIDEAGDGLAAQHKMLKRKYDMVISDWEMPHMSGIDLLTWVRNRPDFGDIPFLMTTANASREEVIKAIQLGVNAYITKPFTMKALTKKMAALLDTFEEGSGI
jgi:DNA-binding response OmpR family regulator